MIRSFPDLSGDPVLQLEFAGFLDRCFVNEREVPLIREANACQDRSAYAEGYDAAGQQHDRQCAFAHRHLLVGTSRRDVRGRRTAASLPNTRLQFFRDCLARFGFRFLNRFFDRWSAAKMSRRIIRTNHEHGGDELRD